MITDAVNLMGAWLADENPDVNPDAGGGNTKGTGTRTGEDEDPTPEEG